ACLQFSRVVLGLGHAFGQRFIPRFRLHHGQLAVAIDQHVIGHERLAAPPDAFNTARRNGVFAQDPAALDHAPSCCFQRGVNVLGSGFGFVHGFLREYLPVFLPPTFSTNPASSKGRSRSMAPCLETASPAHNWAGAMLPWSRSSLSSNSCL